MDIYRELGVEPIINAAGSLTTAGGSMMPPEVTDAMNQASRSFVVMEELHIAAGKRIAELIGVEAAHVTSCAAAGISMMAAASMTGTDRERIRQLPDTKGMRDEFIVQRPHRQPFERAVCTAGGKLVEVEPEAGELEGAIGGQTAALFYTFAWMTPGEMVPLAQAAELAHARGISAMVDAAAEVPPVSNLRRYLREGADLVTFSGGKSIRGPQSSGLVLGRRDLVEACRLNDCPNAGIGRAMKTGKEDIVGLVKAVELYLARDHEADLAVFERKLQYILDQLEGIPHVRAWRQLPWGTGQHLPQIAMTWDPGATGFDHRECAARMLAGSPRIAVQVADPRGRPTESVPEMQVRVHMHCLQEGEEVAVARRLREVLSEAG